MSDCIQFCHSCRGTCNGDRLHCTRKAPHLGLAMHHGVSYPTNWPSSERRIGLHRLVLATLLGRTPSHCCFCPLRTCWLTARRVGIPKYLSCSLPSPGRSALQIEQYQLHIELPNHMVLKFGTILRTSFSVTYYGPAFTVAIELHSLCIITLDETLDHDFENLLTME